MVVACIPGKLVFYGQSLQNDVIAQEISGVYTDTTIFINQSVTLHVTLLEQRYS